MARGFGTTLGSAASDIITSTVTGSTGTLSFHAWVYWRAAGGGTGGRVLDASAGNTGGYHLSQNGSAYLFTALFSGGVGLWTSNAAPTATTWQPMGVKYNTAAVGNDPTVYQNNVKKTVGSGLTRTTTPIGSINAPGAICIGNRSGVDRGWDGELAEVGFWNVLLDDAEFAALGAGYSPTLIRTSALIEYVPLLRANGSFKAAAPTVSGTVVQPHPRTIRQVQSPQQLLHSVPTFKAAWAMDNNLPVLGTGNY